MKQRSFWFGLSLSLTLLAGVCGIALAHANLIRSSPAADERLTASPQTIALFFDDELDTRASRFQVYDTNNPSLSVVEGRVDLNDPYHARLIAENVPTLPEGVYNGRWTALSATDGDTTEGEFDFIVGNAAPRLKPTATTAPASALTVTNIAPPPGTGTPNPPSEFRWLPFAIVGGLAAVLTLMAIGLIRGRRS